MANSMREEANEDTNTKPTARVLSPVSMAGTPRSSMDFYTMSNNSSETLASEYIGPNPGRQPGRNGHSRQPSHLGPVISHTRLPETLMMGYVQLMGSFTLDGSLVNSAPFETVKRKGVIGGQGSGGVVGVDRPKKDSGLFGALGWSSIGESIGGFLGGSELSSIREMKGIANTNSVPIITTPQSILFVDLKLAPGESKSFWYTHTLPRGVPPTHKGRAMKISYQLVIGTQRAQSTAQQHIVKHVEVPFRVLAGVNGNGDILGHDLMHPHILLKNIAHSEPIDFSSRPRNNPTKVKPLVRGDSYPDELQLYVESLLDKPRQNSSLGLLSPTEAPTPRTNQTYFSEDASVKEMIDFAIVRGNAMNNSKRNANKFQIQRGGEKVAVIMLARPAYRLGETVTAVVDFQEASLCCYSLHVSLETSEVVDPAIALRSSSSIHRATRRVHTISFEDTLFTQKATFSAMIPTNFAPEFVTSGVECQWQLRFEFLTGTAVDGIAKDEGLLEEISSDDRATIRAAAQKLSCESFDVSVPIRVYGATMACDDRNGLVDYPI
ncbi:hypothetical protein MMC30_008354 [Trapelia coarctata]|nr:hypothetical protein [Trapelia coarctata]